MPTLEELEDEERDLYQGRTAAAARAATAPTPLPEADPPIIVKDEDGDKEGDPKPQGG